MVEEKEKLSNFVPGVSVDVPAPCVSVGSAYQLIMVLPPIAFRNVPEAEASQLAMGAEKPVSLIAALPMTGNVFVLMIDSEEVVRMSCGLGLAGGDELPDALQGPSLDPQPALFGHPFFIGGGAPWTL